MNNNKYDTKSLRDTESRNIADQNNHDLSDQTEMSALNRTHQSATCNIDPYMNYLSINMQSINTQYFDDQKFRNEFNSNTNFLMVHLNIRSIPEHFIQPT